MNAVEILPVLSPSVTDRKGLAGALLAADPASGALTWVPDNGKTRARGTVSAPLPGHGPGAVCSVVQASYVLGDPTFGGQRMERLLFLGEDGRCLWTSRAYLDGQLDQAWPLRSLEDLQALGLTAGRQSFRTARTMQKAHPGSAPRLQWLSPPLIALPAMAAALLVLGVVVLSVWLSGG